MSTVSKKCLKTWLHDQHGVNKSLRCRFNFNSDNKDVPFTKASCYRPYHFLRENDNQKASNPNPNPNPNHNKPLTPIINSSLVLYDTTQSFPLVPNASTTRRFSTGHHPPGTTTITTGDDDKNNNSDNNNKNNNKSRKEKMHDAAHKGGKVVKKGARSIKDIVQLHGMSFIGSYFVLWAGTVSIFFGALDSGLIDPMTLMNFDLPWHSGAEQSEQDASDAKEISSSIDFIAAKMENYKWTEPYADLVRDKPRISNFAIAVVATKFTEPLRIGLTLGIAPKISKMRGIKVDDEDEDDDNKNTESGINVASVDKLEGIDKPGEEEKETNKSQTAKP